MLLVVIVFLCTSFGVHNKNIENGIETKEILSTKPTVNDTTKEGVLKEQWEGEWNRKETSSNESATITIANVTSSGFNFDLLAISNFNTGDITGVANFIEGKAIFKGEEDAEITFTLKDCILTIEQNEEASYYAGMGVYFSGEYIKGKSE